jgi:glycerol-3-phosphate dehydrogenase (NAD(P)+)
MVAALSGPNHAEEVAICQPAATVIACTDENAAKRIQGVFTTPYFRPYTNTDIVGVELAGALKNIIAIALGLLDGLGYQDNMKAATMTRGLAEISRLGIALGARPVTFLGLAGMGDLIATCTSKHSRNRRCGIMIGEGMAPKEAMEKIGMVVEGMYTTEAAYALAKKNRVSMPITEHIYAVISGALNAQDMANSLMRRSKKHELEEELLLKRLLRKGFFKEMIWRRKPDGKRQRGL